MPLDLNTNRALQLPSELRMLVEAVARATPNDEVDWIEWKSNRDLSRTEDVADVGRHILAFANRNPDFAHRNAEGYGYLIIGVEPGQVHGITPIDPAVLEAKLRPYLGGDLGPGWWPHYVEVSEKTVLVVSVAPPKWGDPIRLLRKSFRSYPRGTVFVRRRGATEVADDSEMDMLQQRFTRSRQRIDVLVGWAGETLTIPAVDLSAEAINAWVEAEKATIAWPPDQADGTDENVAEPDNISRSESKTEGTAPAKKPTRHHKNFDLRGSGKGPSVQDIVNLERREAAGEELTDEESETLDAAKRQLAATMQSITEALSRSGRLMAREQRSRAEYISEVEAYLRSCAVQLPAVVVGAIASSNMAALQLVLINNSDRNLPSVEVIVTAKSSVLAFSGDEDELQDSFPRPPRPWGTPPPSAPLLPSFRVPALTSPRIPTISELEIDNSMSTRVTFRPIDLRPEAREALPGVHMLATRDLMGQTIELKWQATSTGADGVAHGKLRLVVRSDVVAPLDVVAPGRG